MQSALPEETSSSGEQTPSEPTPCDRLDSWKEIAVYFRRDVRTVRRWEESLGLPVRRHRHNRGVAVYAYKGEVDAWWRQRDVTAAEAVGLPSQIPRRVGPLGWAVVALLVTLGLLRSGVWRASPPSGVPAAAADVVPLAGYPGIEEYPSLSPDAHHFAFSWNGVHRRNFDIYRKALDRSPADPVRLTSDPAADFNPTWSPDGHSIAFVRQTAPSEFKIMMIPAAGGKERSLTTCEAAWDRRAGSYLAWTPDGRGLLVLQRESHGQAAGLLLLSPKSGLARRLVIPLDGSRAAGNESVGGPLACLAAG